MPSKRRNAKHEARHEELTAIALDLFAERGYLDTRIKAIAKKAGINPALIYYYYKDKADLFRAAIVNLKGLVARYLGIDGSVAAPVRRKASKRASR